MSKADSVVLISHITTKEFAPKIVPDVAENDSEGLKRWYEEYPPAPPYLINEDINGVIILESATLSKKQIEQLSEVINRKFYTDTIEYARCDNPVNSILIYTQAKLSFIDICFGCRRVHCSSDIKLSEEHFDDTKWQMLELLFRERGIKKGFDEKPE
ncbi:MAG: hypothetical protein IT252_16200 [Chitinophagaceae bacterium]|nr:hypothetical protein [Chitinophagaceae bacterium]